MDDSCSLEPLRLPSRIGFAHVRSSNDERGHHVDRHLHHLYAPPRRCRPVAFLRRHLLGASTLSDDDVVSAAATFVPQRLEKGAHLLTPGDVCRFSAVVTSGCLRVYVADPDGAEGVLYFAPEGWWVGDPDSLLHRGPSRLGIDAVLNTDVLVFDRTRRHPSDAGPCERLLRLATEHSLLRLHKRLAGRMCKSAAQRYIEFRRQYPGLDLRIPQYQVAGYLGFSARAGTQINGGMFTVPTALGSKIIHPYSDFLTHDIGSGDGIPILPTAEYAHTAPLMRTAPLWGLRTRNRLMHDGLSFTLEEAIGRHRGQADGVRLNYDALSSSEKLALIAFLNSL